MMGKNCATCAHRWYGEAGGKVKFAWHCRKDLTLKRHQLPVIGTDAELKVSKGCGDYSKKLLAQSKK